MFSLKFKVGFQLSLGIEPSTAVAARMTAFPVKSHENKISIPTKSVIFANIRIDSLSRKKPLA